jgi:3',5'-cyclic AMP phosphodiesterase CpdA
MPRVFACVLLAALLAAGCGSPAVPRDRITFAVLGGVYYSAVPGLQVEGAMVEDAEALLVKAVADLNAAKDLDFVILAGDLLAQADGLSLDRVKAILSDLRVPYFMVLGEHDGPATGRAKAAGNPPPAAPCGLSRDSVAWAFQGHGFAGADGYWCQDALPGLVLVGLDTVRPGGAAGHVSPRQLEWLDKTLASRPGKAVIVVAYHELVPMHPLDEGAAWRHKMVENAAQVRQVLDRHPNVLAVLAGGCHFAEGRVAGRILYLSSPGVAIWPLAYSLVRLTPKEAEVLWVPLAPDDTARRAQERLLRSNEYRGIFPVGEDGDTACVRLFGGKKMETYSLPGIRP